MSSYPSPSPSPFSISSFPLSLHSLRSVLSISDYSREELEILLLWGKWILKFGLKGNSAGRHALSTLLHPLILCPLFLEPSTRTNCSFQAAMLRLGGKIIFPSEFSSSSMAKGETLSDTVKCLEQYADVIVLRQKDKGVAHTMSALCNIPIINAGDGTGEHPTQAMLDLLTISEEMSSLSLSPSLSFPSLRITIIGDLLNGRTVHSLIQILCIFGVKYFHLVSPQSLKFPNEILSKCLLSHPKVTFSEFILSGEKENSSQIFKEILPKTDFLYVTRVQKERFSDEKEYHSVSNAYEINKNLLDSPTIGCNPNIRILHPLPRINEISADMDNDPRAAYFRQMQCGMAMRMAILIMVMGKGKFMQNIITKHNETETETETEEEYTK